MKDFGLHELHENMIKHKNIVEDYNYIEKKYGPPNDFCGGWCGDCGDNKFMDLLEDPTYKKAISLYVQLLTVYITKGTESGLTKDAFRHLIKKDKRAKHIFHYWGDRGWE